MRKILCAAAALTLAAAVLSAPAGADPSVTASANEPNVMFSAKKKQKKAKVKVHGQSRVACTPAGCHPIPGNCYPTMGYTWDGIPSGFDVVVCRGRY